MPHLSGTDGLGISRADKNYQNSASNSPDGMMPLGSEPPRLSPPDHTDAINTDKVNSKEEDRPDIDVSGNVKETSTDKSLPSPPPQANSSVFNTDFPEQEKISTHPTAEDGTFNVKNDVSAEDPEQDLLPRLLTVSDFAKVDSAKNLTKKYFHDLLKYINEHDATLDNDVNGDLRFLMNKMPDEELDMTFGEWLQDKVNKIHEEFVKGSALKLQLLKDEFDKIKNRVVKINDASGSDDEWLIDMAKKLDIL